MTVEDLYLENIDEFIKDENKIVTYKWLSQTLQVHCNTAKQMLFKYIETERNIKESGALTVTYFVSGLTKPDENGEQMFKCVVVPEEKLEACKSTFVVLTSCHIYSVQKTRLKDSNLLYMTDFAKFKENMYESNKYSSIKCKRATIRSDEEMDLLTVDYVTKLEPEKKGPVSNGSTASKPVGKKQPQSAIASMFAKVDSTKTAVKDIKKDLETKGDGKTAVTSTNKKKDGMMAFFSKDTGKGLEQSKQGNKRISPKQVEKDKSPAKNESPAKIGTKSKKNTRQEDSDDEAIFGKPKRQRTKQDLFDSESEEEMEDEPESPVPPTPPKRKATPDPVLRDDSPTMEEEPIPEKTSKIEESSKGSKSGEKRRIRKKKWVSKTYMDDNGFMVTEKIQEEESTDASESEEPVKKEIKNSALVKSPAKGKKSPKKPSPGKKGSGKQTSLMSFFKKS